MIRQICPYRFQSDRIRLRLHEIPAGTGQHIPFFREKVDAFLPFSQHVVQCMVQRLRRQRDPAIISRIFSLSFQRLHRKIRGKYDPLLLICIDHPVIVIVIPFIMPHDRLRIADHNSLTRIIHFCLIYDRVHFFDLRKPPGYSFDQQRILIIAGSAPQNIEL